MKELSVEEIRLTRNLIERQGLWCADKRDDWEHAAIDSLLAHITSLEQQLSASKREEKARLYALVDLFAGSEDASGICRQMRDYLDAYFKEKRDEMP